VRLGAPRRRRRRALGGSPGGLHGLLRQRKGSDANVALTRCVFLWVCATALSFLVPVREPAATSTQITHVRCATTKLRPSCLWLLTCCSSCDASHQAGCVIRDDEALSAEEEEAISSKEQALPDEPPASKRRLRAVGLDAWRGIPTVDLDAWLDAPTGAGTAHRASGSPDSRRRVGGRRGAGGPVASDRGGDVDASEQGFADPGPALAERAEASDDDGDGAVEQQVAGLPLAGAAGPGGAPGWTLNRIAGMFSFLSGRRSGVQPGDSM
jgi:hypothetical protein